MDSHKRWTVYVHINKINNKKYVGITSLKPEYRWGRNGSNYKVGLFARAISKYGWDNFDHEIVAENLLENEAKEMEKKLIFELNTFVKSNNGYNLTLGGDGTVGIEVSEETRRKISKASKGRKHSEETKELLREINSGENGYWYGKKQTDEAKKKISEANSGENAYWYGKHHTEETKKKISEKQKGKKFSEESIQKRSIKVICLNDLKIYKSAKEVQDILGLDRGDVGKCCKGKRKTVGGLSWMYLEEYEKLNTNKEVI